MTGGSDADRVSGGPQLRVNVDDDQRVVRFDGDSGGAMLMEHLPPLLGPPLAGSSPVHGLLHHGRVCLDVCIEGLLLNPTGCSALEHVVDVKVIAVDLHATCRRNEEVDMVGCHPNRLMVGVIDRAFAGDRKAFGREDGVQVGSEFSWRESEQRPTRQMNQLAFSRCPSARGQRHFFVA